MHNYLVLPLSAVVASLCEMYLVMMSRIVLILVYLGSFSELLIEI